MDYVMTASLLLYTIKLRISQNEEAHTVREDNFPVLVHLITEGL